MADVHADVKDVGRVLRCAFGELNCGSFWNTQVCDVV